MTEKMYLTIQNQPYGKISFPCAAQTNATNFDDERKEAKGKHTKQRKMPK